MNVCMKETFLTPVLAGSVLAFTFLIAAVGAHDAEQPFPADQQVATRPIGQEDTRPMMAAITALKLAELE